eukprot:TRINITY_DN3210_c0_g1_i1.p1 TRINITY_DN3210_c0_g1~~TRINITY_DN3210_c0_g1_i1.p1  ORF type:complete len:196 (+),score=38.54 TRINITY_DN3210_c0_g1_i1:80-667(+)
MCIRDRYQRRVRGTFWGSRCQGSSAEGEGSHNMGNRCGFENEDRSPPGTQAPKQSKPRQCPLCQVSFGLVNRGSSCAGCNKRVCRGCTNHGQCEECIRYVLFPRNSLQQLSPDDQRERLHDVQRAMLEAARKTIEQKTLKEEARALDRELVRADGLSRVVKEHEVYKYDHKLGASEMRRMTNRRRKTVLSVVNTA